MCKIGNMPFQGIIFIKKREARERLLQNNHKHGLIPKYFNKNIDASRSAPPKSTIARHKPKVKSGFFEDSYDHINYMENTNYENLPIAMHE